MKPFRDNDPLSSEFLKSISLFQELSPEQLEKIHRTMKPIHCRKGQPIIQEGERGDSLYIMRSGEVEMTKTLVLKGANRGFEDRDKSITRLRTGEDSFFGEIGLLMRTVRTTTVRAIEDCELYEITKPDFDRLADADTDLGLKVTRALARVVCKRLAVADQDIIKLTTALSIAIR